MDITPVTKTIKDLLGSGKQFIIPRFQREYSWETKNYQEFLEDVISGVRIESNNIIGETYFLGTMLFVGDFTKGNQREIMVVDGQQRLTTITILFSALSQCFKNMNLETLGKRLFEYIMTKDDNDEEVRVLQSRSHYPYFAYFIQDIEKVEKVSPGSIEEECIFEAYEFLLRCLQESNLRKIFENKTGYDYSSIEYIDLLKTVRDQILNCIFISISTTDKKRANQIFEILNAKGKRLAHIDLIKNKIFEELNTTEPADFAFITWEEIKDNLNKSTDVVGIATFYQHYWSSKYKKSYSTTLYDDFKKMIKPVDYKTFLKDMKKNSEYYLKVIKPTKEDYGNRKEYFWLVQSLKVFNDYFDIVVNRIVLLSLFDASERNILNHKWLKKTVKFIEDFHFAYTAVTSNKSNKLESIYSKFAIELRKCSDSNAAINCIRQLLFEKLIGLLPSYEVFEEKFIQIRYIKTKKADSINMKAKYILNRINCYYQNNELFSELGSVEHILSETNQGLALNIGNLILLEEPINNRLGQIDYCDKIDDYNTSQYSEVRRFVQDHPNWDESMIEERAKQMSKLFYEHILSCKVDKI